MTAPTTTALLPAAQGDGDAGLPTLADFPEIPVEELEAFILQQPAHLVAEDFPLVHRFAPGVYAREITMPADTIVIGKVHRTRHLNLISQGDVSFWMQGEPVRRVRAPYTFVSEPGVRKVLYVHEETVWTTIHPTEETDLEVLEALLIEPHVNPLLNPLPTPLLEVAR